MPNSYFDRMLPGSAGSRKHEAGKEVLDLVEYSGASYVWGYLMHRYGERASKWGVPADLGGGLLASAAALGLGLAGYGGGLTPLIGNVGRAGVGAFCHTLGAGHGSKKSGTTRMRLDAKDADKAQKALAAAGVKTTVFGAIPQAPHGDFLSTRDLRQMAAG
jgi:hypothetical protein